MQNQVPTATISYSEQLQIACKQYQIVSTHIDILDSSSKPIPGDLWQQREYTRDRIISLAIAGFQDMAKRVPK